MSSRAAELRARHRKIFAWSLGVAVLLHVAVFWLSPTFRAEPLGGMEVQGYVETGTDGPLMELALFFGPPTIFPGDGEPWTEPAERVLEAGRVVRLSAGCEGFGLPVPLTGRARLRVDPAGHTMAVEVAESTGEPCADEALTIVADALRYHWLPNERFPAPVEVVQPVTLVGARTEE